MEVFASSLNCISLTFDTLPTLEFFIIIYDLTLDVDLVFAVYVVVHKCSYKHQVDYNISTNVKLSIQILLPCECALHRFFSVNSFTGNKILKKIDFFFFFEALELMIEQATTNRAGCYLLKYIIYSVAFRTCVSLGK